MARKGKAGPRAACLRHDEAGGNAAHAPAFGKAQPPGLLSYMPSTRIRLKSGRAARAWHKARYIPELRQGTNGSRVLRAFEKCDVSPKVAVLNYFDLPRWLLRRPEKCAELREKTKNFDGVILSCVGRDNDLDRYSVEHYDAVARAIKADAVTTPDEYIYGDDDVHRTFQARNFLRAKSRSAALLKIPGKAYSVIGLAVGRDARQVDSYMDFLARRGVDDWAFPCGDYLKGAPATVPVISHFVRRVREEGSWAVLLGVSSKNRLLGYRPPAFSNLAPSYDPAHDRSDGNYIFDWPFSRTPAKKLEERCLDTMNYYKALGDRW